MIRTVKFKRVRGRDVPLKPWPQKFYMSRELLDENDIEIRPLTFMGLIKGIGKNFITMSYWRFMYGLFYIGFLNTKKGNVLSWKDFRWCFWRPRKSSIRKKRRRK